MGERLIGDLDVQEVVGLGALGALVQDGVEHVAVELVEGRVVGEEDEVVCQKRVVLVVGEVEELVEVLVNGQVDRLGALDGRGATRT